LLARQVTCVTVLDISAAAIARAQARLGPAQSRVTWIQADVVDDWPVPVVDIWHDRAVFHFLTEADDRARYRARLRAGLRPGGSLIVAAFGPEGPPMCSGLPTVRYSPEALSIELGASYSLQEAVREMHQTPFGTSQEFWYSRFSYRA
jgi:SAM-dependent methyltransferase